MSKATQANKKANENFSEVKLNIFFKNRVAFQEEGDHASPKAEARAKASRARKAGLKGAHSNKKGDADVTHLPVAHNTAAWEAAQISSEERP